MHPIVYMYANESIGGYSGIVMYKLAGFCALFSSETKTIMRRAKTVRHANRLVDAVFNKSFSFGFIRDKCTVFGVKAISSDALTIFITPRKIDRVQGIAWLIFNIPYVLILKGELTLHRISASVQA